LRQLKEKLDIPVSTPRDKFDIGKQLIQESIILDSPVQCLRISQFNKKLIVALEDRIEEHSIEDGRTQLISRLAGLGVPVDLIEIGRGSILVGFDNGTVAKATLNNVSVVYQRSGNVPNGISILMLR